MYVPMGSNTPPLKMRPIVLTRGGKSDFSAADADLSIESEYSSSLANEAEQFAGGETTFRHRFSLVASVKYTCENTQKPNAFARNFSD